MNKAQVVASVEGALLPLYMAERRRLIRIDRWYRHDPDLVHVPRGATQEVRRLAELARTPWLGLVVNVVAQTMVVDGYRSPDDKANTAAWRTWHENGFESRQVAIHKAALAYGYAYVSVLPGENDLGDDSVVMQGHSPLTMQALWGDAANDDYPTLAIKVIRDQPGNRWHLRVYDDENVYYLDCADGGDDVRYLSEESHGVGVTPIVRYAGNLDLDGRADGEVEPFIPIAARINKTDYDRLMVQHFASWKVRTVAGMKRPDNDEDAAAIRLRLRQDDLLIAEDADAKFGTLDASSLDGFIAAKRDDVESLAAVSQTPTHALTGDLINIGAEALASARAQLEQKTGERKLSIGESHCRSLRLAALIRGEAVAARDVTARVTWQDTSIRSMAQAVDALGKAATMLQIPVRSLWPLIPGINKADVDEWIESADSVDPLGQLADKLLGDDKADAPPANDATELKAKFDALGVAVRAGVDPNDAATRLGLTGLQLTGATPSSLRLPLSEADGLEEK